MTAGSVVLNSSKLLHCVPAGLQFKNERQEETKDNPQQNSAKLETTGRERYNQSEARK
ncbi:UNVERIFIED_CONTAM: hypothetical protein FKN15_061583 [Acipenser sinensis]